MTAESTFEGWAIVELMGHRRLGAWVSEAEIGGASMLRLDIPGDSCAACGHPETRHTSGGMCAGDPPDGSECHCVLIPPLKTDVYATQFYSASALYCLTPSTEEMARAVRSRPEPVTSWELPRPQLPAATVDENDDDEYEDEWERRANAEIGGQP